MYFCVCGYGYGLYGIDITDFIVNKIKVVQTILKMPLNHEQN